MSTNRGKYLWVFLFCRGGKIGYGSFSSYMDHPPVVGRTMEMYGIPEYCGEIEGEIIKVHESIKFQHCTPIKQKHRFGFTAAYPVEVLPAILEFQVWFEIKGDPTQPL